MSAEAVPGPACYGRGGTRPTTSDANLVLGRLGSETRLGGNLRLDLAAARNAIETHVAKPLGIDAVAAAVGILRVAHANIVRGIRVVSVERGHDPRQCTLVPFGGAGPMHGTPVARELQIGRLIVPPAPGILCALGQLLADLRHDLVETHIFPYAAGNAARARAIAQRLRRGGRSAARRRRRADGQARDRGARGGALRRARATSCRSPFVIATPTAGSRIAADFHAAHRHRFGHADPEAPIEIVGFGATAIGKVDTPELPALRPGGAAPPAEALPATRDVFFEGDGDRRRRGGWVAAQIFEREKLLADNVIEGPAVIEEVSATTVLYPGDRARVHANGALLVECGP